MAEQDPRRSRASSDQGVLDAATLHKAAQQIARWREALIVMLSDEERQAYLDGTALQRLRDVLPSPLPEIVLADEGDERVAVRVRRRTDDADVVLSGVGATIAEAVDELIEALERA